MENNKSFKYVLTWKKIQIDKQQRTYKNKKNKAHLFPITNSPPTAQPTCFE